MNSELKERTISLLKELEWRDENLFHCLQCPICGGHKKVDWDDVRWHSGDGEISDEINKTIVRIKENSSGHRDGCDIAVILKELEEK